MGKNKECSEKAASFTLLGVTLWQNQEAKECSQAAKDEKRDDKNQAKDEKRDDKNQAKDDKREDREERQENRHDQQDDRLEAGATFGQSVQSVFDSVSSGVSSFFGGSTEQSGGYSAMPVDNTMMILGFVGVLAGVYLITEKRR